MSSADHVVPGADQLPTAGAHRRPGTTGRARTTRRWAVGVLTAATVALLGYVAFLLWMAWMFASAWGALVSHDPVQVDVMAVVSDVAPALLVGWCTGLATSAVLARGEAVGPRTAGAVAGLVGTVAGTAILAWADLI